MTLVGASSNPATISALAAIFGSLTGALASSVSTWITLYTDFISETASVMADAIQHNFQDPNKLSFSYAILSRMRLSSSNDVLASAERVIQYILSEYAEPNLTLEEIQSGAVKRKDPLREFSSICRTELEAMQRQLRWR